MSRWLDCCDAPNAKVLFRLHDTSHHDERVSLCACGQRWFIRFHEDVDWGGGEDDMQLWCTRISLAEATRLQAAHALGQRPDLSFLAHRPCVYVSPSGEISTRQGAPTEPWPSR